MSTATLGIDLSAQPRETGCCVVAWGATGGRVVELGAGYGDDAITALVAAHRPTKIAIDSPFGWPLEFIRTISEFTATGRWPATEDRRPLLFRRTDLFVGETTGVNPLSVSSNLLAICAMRCARLLSALHGEEALDRSGAGRVVEVYPAAALRQWGLDPRGYKGSKLDRRERRRVLVGDFSAAVSPWLALDVAATRALESSDHLLDALVSAVVGRAAEVGQTLPTPGEHSEAASAEGWIHLPPRRPLSELDLLRRPPPERAA